MLKKLNIGNIKNRYDYCKLAVNRYFYITVDAL